MWGQKLHSLAHEGLTFAQRPGDIERYKTIMAIAAEITARHSELEFEAVLELFERESGFVTPKVATRAAVFDAGRIMLVRELRDDLWVLPGGYCDLNEPPSQAAAREVLEETGFAVRPTRLLAVYDRKRTLETIRWTHFYTMFFDCESLGQVAAPKELETSAMGFFGLEELPPLNPNQTVEQLERIFELHRDASLPPDFD
jgi:ADP-ribose pyrophosphatase YjhB (NUDIX family)